MACFKIYNNNSPHFFAFIAIYIIRFILTEFPVTDFKDTTQSSLALNHSIYDHVYSTKTLHSELSSHEHFVSNSMKCESIIVSIILPVTVHFYSWNRVFFIFSLTIKT